MFAIKGRGPWWAWPLLLVFSPLVILAFVLWLAAAIVLQLVVWIAWCSRGPVRARGVLGQPDLAGVLRAARGPGGGRPGRRSQLVGAKAAGRIRFRLRCSGCSQGLASSTRWPSCF